MSYVDVPGIRRVDGTQVNPATEETLNNRNNKFATLRNYLCDEGEVLFHVTAPRDYPGDRLHIRGPDGGNYSLAVWEVVHFDNTNCQTYYYTNQVFTDWEDIPSNASEEQILQAQGLYAMYHLNEGGSGGVDDPGVAAGATATDSSGYGRHAEYQTAGHGGSNTAPVNSISSGAYRPQNGSIGSARGVVCPFSIDGWEEFTICGWYGAGGQIGAYPNNEHMFSNYNSGGSEPGVEGRVYSFNRQYTALLTTGSGYTGGGRVDGTVSLVLNYSKTHWAFRYNVNTREWGIFDNGNRLEHFTNIPVGWTMNQSKNLILCKRYVQDNSTFGRFSTICIFNKYLTDQQITDLYNRQK